MRRMLAAIACLALAISLLPASVMAAAPSNDNVADATVLTGTSGSVSGTNAEATLEANETAVFNPNNSYDLSVWYKWSPGRKNLIATFATCDGTTGSLDTVLQVYTGITAPPTWGSFTNVAWEDDSCGAQTRVDFLAEAGVTYWIRFTGYDALDYAAFTLTWTTAPTVRGTLGVTLTNTRGVPTDCTMVVKGVDLTPGQEFQVASGSGQFASFTTLVGRWTSDPVYLPRSFWSVGTVGSLSLNNDVLSADGYSVVVPKFVNRCK